MIVVWTPYIIHSVLFFKLKAWKNCQGVGFLVLIGTTRVKIHNSGFGFCARIRMPYMGEIGFVYGFD